MKNINSGLHITTIMDLTVCGVHEAQFDQPCWDVVNPVTGDRRRGVCGRRAAAAGYSAPISPISLRKN